MRNIRQLMRLNTNVSLDRPIHLRLPLYDVGLHRNALRSSFAIERKRDTPLEHLARKWKGKKIKAFLPFFFTCRVNVLTNK